MTFPSELYLAIFS